MTEHKTISFRVDSLTYKALQTRAKKKYLSLSAYIRKCLDEQLEQEDTNNDFKFSTL